MRSWISLLGSSVGVMRAAWVALAVGGCAESRPAAEKEPPAVRPAAPPEGPVAVEPRPGGDPVVAAPPKDAPEGLLPRPADVKRDIHPRGGGDLCLEMYSACDAKGLCTSAPFNLECGELGTIPGGDKVRCVCP